IAGEPRTGLPLATRMTHYRTPAVSVAVMQDGRIAWTQAWGVADQGSGRTATTGTLFQAASISKPVAATAALALVGQGALDLDADVNRYLTSWKVPTSTDAHGQAVTLRRLLSHTAGLTVSGFPGYARSARLPSAVEVLRGQGNTPAVVVDTTPGAVWRYSGGGYTIAQLLMSDVTRQPFATLLHERVLVPLGMTHSTFEQPLPPARHAEAATGYRSNGAPVAENWHVYPEQAAAGLWTTPEDLARFGLAILRAYHGADGGVISPAAAREMLTPVRNEYGLGFGVSADGKSFGHGGSNAGFRSQLTVFMDGRGAAVMTNSDVGNQLAREMLGTLSELYGWPAFRPVERTAVTLPVAALSALAGTYQFPNDGDGVMSVEDGRLFFRHPALGRQELRAASEQTLFSTTDGAVFTVERDGGSVVAIRAFGRRAERRPGGQALDWQRLAEALVTRMDLQRGERVLLVAHPGPFDPLIPVLRGAITRAGGTVVGDSVDFSTVALGVMLPGPTPADSAYAAMQRVLRSGRGRTIHFHWAGAYDLEGNVLPMTDQISQLYQRALLQTDYAALGAKQREFEEALRGATVRVTTPLGTDLSFRIGDRPVTRQDGDASARRAAQARNLIDREVELPAGAIRVAPLESTVTGRIAFPTGTWNGTRVEGLVMTFRQGRVVSYEARAGRAAVAAEVERSGEASRSFREFALGFNPLLAMTEAAPAWIPYYGYGAGVVRLSLGDNTELGGAVTGGYVRWNFFPDATVTVGSRVWVRDGRLVR
ncbi:MAG TPA: aminopeptidase, partial [Gemmatimonadales bacterium]|nr:aminopeptidase [Gemmatimonadales bacterium]